MKGLLQVPALAWVAQQIGASVMGWFPRLEAEPDGLAEALHSLPQRVLTDEERAEFRRSGVVHIPGALPNPGLMDFLAESISHVATTDDVEGLHKAWFFHGPIRALVRDDLLAGLAVSALGAKLGEGGRWAALEEAPIWASVGYVHGGSPVDLYHADDRFHIQRPFPLVSVWLALTDSVTPIEFLRGSHEVLHQINFGCGREMEGGVAKFLVYPHHCMTGFHDLLENLTGVEPFYSVNVSKGDVFVFHGHTLHRKLEQLLPRLAITIRYNIQDGGRPLDMSRIFQYVFPRSAWDPDTIPWVLVPSLGSLSPVLPPETRGRAREWVARWTSVSWLSWLR